MFGFSTVPLRLATTLGFAMALLATCLFVRAAALKLFLGTGLHGWTSLIAVVVLIGSAQARLPRHHRKSTSDGCTRR